MPLYLSMITNRSKNEEILHIAQTAAYYLLVSKEPKNSQKTSSSPLSPYWTPNYTNSLSACKSGEPISAALTTTYGYDYFDNRVFLKTATTTTFYPFTNFATTTTGTTTKYIYANGEPIARIVGSTTNPVIFYVHADHLGSPQVLSDTNGTMAEVLSYMPFGEVRIDDKVSANSSKKYIAQEFDAQTGNLYLNARYQNPVQGQFLSQDPVHLAIGDPNQIQQLTKLQMDQVLSDPQLLNSYSYARNNPIILKDPEGKIAFVPVILGVFSAYGWAKTYVDYLEFQNVTTYPEQFSINEINHAGNNLLIDIYSLGAGRLATEVGRNFLNMGSGVVDVTAYYGEKLQDKFKDEKPDSLRKKDQSHRINLPTPAISTNNIGGGGGRSGGSRSYQGSNSGGGYIDYGYGIILPAPRPAERGPQVGTNKDGSPVYSWGIFGSTPTTPASGKK